MNEPQATKLQNWLRTMMTIIVPVVAIWYALNTELRDLRILLTEQNATFKVKIENLEAHIRNLEGDIGELRRLVIRPQSSLNGGNANG